jgi:hypothetical protein
MKFTQDALRLTKEYATGASCKIDFKNIERTMFYPHYLLIAKNKKLGKITVEVVREYWLGIHNKIVVKRFMVGDLNPEEAKKCMVRLLKSEDKLFAVHGNRTVDILTTEQAKALREEIEKAPKSLR